MPAFTIPASQIRAGSACAKEKQVATANKVKVTCTKISNFLFWSVSPVTNSENVQTPVNGKPASKTPAPVQTQAPKQNPDEVFGPGGLCDIDGQYLPTEKGDVLLCSPNAGKLRWTSSSDSLPTNGIYPGMKCDSLNLIIPSATGKNVECTLFKGNKVWIYKN